MNKTITIITCQLLIVWHVFPQTSKLDSLLTNLQHTTGEARVTRLHEIIKAAWTTDPNAVIPYARESIQLSKELEDLSLLSTSYRIFGGLYNYMSEIDSGHYYKTKALELAIQIEDSILIASSYNNLGVTSQTTGNYVEALRYYYLAYLIGKKSSTFPNLPIIMSNISEVYYDLKEYDSAIRYAKYAMNMTQSQPFSSQHLLILNTLARAELANGNFQKARNLYNDILTTSKSIGEKRYAAYAYQGLGKMFVQNGSIYPAKKHLFQALKLFQVLDDESYISEIYQDLSLLMIKSDPDSSFYYARKSLILAKNLDLQDIMLSNYNILIDLFSQNRIIDSLQYYQSLYHAMEAAIRKKNNLNSIEGMFAKIRDEEMRTRISNQALKLEKKTFQTNFFIALAAITFLLSGFIFRYYRKQKRLGKYLSEVNQEVTRQNDLIDGKNKKLQALNNEKNDLINIVAHDLKNPLSNIVTSVQIARESPEAENEQALLQIAEDSARRLSDMITKILDVEAIEKGLSALHLVSVDLSEIMNSVCDDFEIQASNKCIKINRDISDQVFVCAEPTYLYQVIENLVSNAIKFSPNEKSVFINLKIDKILARIEVKDEGPGISDKEQTKLFQMYQKLSPRPTGDEHSSGIGLSIVKKFVDSMQGRIWCKSKIGAGTSFYVQFKLA